MNSRTPKGRFRIGIGIGFGCGFGFGWIDRIFVYVLYTVLYYCTAVLYYYCNYCKNDFTALI